MAQFKVNKPMWKPQQLCWTSTLATKQTAPKTVWKGRPLLGAFTCLESSLKTSCLEPWNLVHPLLGTLTSLGTLTWNLCKPLYTWNPCSDFRNLPKPTWNLGASWNLYLELLQYLEPRNHLELWNLLGPLLGTLPRKLGTSWHLYLEPLLGTSEPSLGTLSRLEPSLKIFYLEPWNLLDPWLGTLTWNLGTFRNLYLEPSLGTSEPRGTLRDDCPRVPQGLVWLRPQSFLSLLGKKSSEQPDTFAKEWFRHIMADELKSWVAHQLRNASEDNR